MLAGAKNVEGARALIDFMLSERFQAAVPDSMFVLPVRDGNAAARRVPPLRRLPARAARAPGRGDRPQPRPLDRRVDADRPALRRGWHVAAALVPAAFVALFFAFPLAAILERGLTSEGGLSLPAGTAELLWFTTWQAAASTVLTLAAGLPLAWAIGRFRFRGRSLARALVLVPFVLPTVVVATAFLDAAPGRLRARASGRSSPPTSSSTSPSSRASSEGRGRRSIPRAPRPPPCSEQARSAGPGR